MELLLPGGHLGAIATDDSSVGLHLLAQLCLGRGGKNLRRAALDLRESMLHEVTDRFEGLLRTVQERVHLEDVDL